MYVMSYFRAQSEALHFAVSDDGFVWQPVNRNVPVLVGSVGARTLRDPFVFRGHDSTFHLLATDGWESDSIVHACSGDLITWSEQVLVPVMGEVPGVKNCWAPECFFDDAAGCYRIVWSSTVTLDDVARADDHRIWSATTPDFVTYSEPSVFFDPGFSVIDANIVRDGDRYVMAFKDERGANRAGTDHKRIHTCSRPTVGGPWTPISDAVTPALTEGPTMFRRGETWTMFFDHFHEGFFGGVESPDGLRWTDITDRLAFPPGVRHASVLQADAPVVRRLLARWEVQAVQVS